jgi:hypothetical protein
MASQYIQLEHPSTIKKMDTDPVLATVVSTPEEPNETDKKLKKPKTEIRKPRKYEFTPKRQEAFKKCQDARKLNLEKKRLAKVNQNV